MASSITTTAVPATRGAPSLLRQGAGLATAVTAVPQGRRQGQRLPHRDPLRQWHRARLHWPPHQKTSTPVITQLQSRESAVEFLKNDQTFYIGLFKNYEGADHGEFLKGSNR